MQLNLKLPADFENEITVLYINIEVKFAVLKQYLEHVAFLFRAGYEKSVGKLDSLPKDEQLMQGNSSWNF